MPRAQGWGDECEGGREALSSGLVGVEWCTMAGATGF